MGQSYKKSIQDALVAGLAILMAGCAGPAQPATTETPANPATTQTPPIQSSPQRPPNNSQPGGNADKRYVIARELAGLLRVSDVRLTRGPDGYLKVQVNLQNLTEAPQQFSYRVDWFNEYGDRLHFGTEDFTSWMLLPRETSTFAVTAPSPTASDCGIAIVPLVK